MDEQSWEPVRGHFWKFSTPAGFDRSDDFKTFYSCAEVKLEQVLLLKMSKFIALLLLTLELQHFKVGGFGKKGPIFWFFDTKCRFFDTRPEICQDFWRFFYASCLQNLSDGAETFGNRSTHGMNISWKFEVNPTTLTIVSAHFIIWCRKIFEPQRNKGRNPTPTQIPDLKNHQ